MDPFEKLCPRFLADLSRTTTVVLVLLDWDEHREQFVQLIRDLGTEVRVFVVKSGPTSRKTDGAIRLVDPEEERRGIEEL